MDSSSSGDSEVEEGGEGTQPPPYNGKKRKENRGLPEPHSGKVHRKLPQYQKATKPKRTPSNKVKESGGDGWSSNELPQRGRNKRRRKKQLCRQQRS